MPKKDPATGCMVQTLGEFWHAEAEREGQGRSGGEIALEFWEEIEADSCRCERELLGDKEGFLRTLQSWDKDCDEEDRIRFTGVAEILDAVVEQGGRSSSTIVVARVHTEVNGEIFVHFCSWHESGGYYDPPEGGNDVLIWDRDKAVSYLRERAPECERLYDVLELMGEV